MMLAAAAVSDQRPTCQNKVAPRKLPIVYTYSCRKASSSNWLSRKWAKRVNAKSRMILWLWVQLVV